MDKQSIFRRESLDRVESPEQLDAYIKVSHPKVWLIMAALLVAVISVIVMERCRKSSTDDDSERSYCWR